MKHFASLCILLVLINFSTQVPKRVNCPENMEAPCECCQVICLSETEMTMTACPLVSPPLCTEGSQLTYLRENTKMYPDCCPYITCSK